jgi:hypothetical protein
MTIFLTARSISRPLCASLMDVPRPAHGHVLGVFRQACDVELAGYGIVAIVTDLIGDGPFHVVVRAGADLDRIGPADPVMLASGRLAIGPVAVDLRSAAVWEPSPDWTRLRNQSRSIAAALRDLRHALDTTRGPPLALALGSPAAGLLAAAVHAADADLRAGWAGNDASLSRGVARLAGLGPGLTPAGDDFLLGLLVWAWLAHPTPAAFGRTVSGTASPRTTALAAAWLTAAADGYVGTVWHRFLATVARDAGPAEILAAADRVLDFGATSGADALAGLLWFAGQ